MVFRLPKDDSTDYIKRVIGLPGDRIRMREGLLYINDKPIKRERLSDFIGEDPCGSDATPRVKRWKETLPNAVSYETLDCVDNGFQQPGFMVRLDGGRICCDFNGLSS